MNLVNRIRIFTPLVNFTQNGFKTISRPNVCKKTHSAPRTQLPFNRYFKTEYPKVVFLGFSLLSIFGFEDEEDCEQKLINTIKRGLLCLQKEDYECFEQKLHEALKIANNIKSFEGVTYVYDVLANGAFMKKDYVNAEKLFVLVMQRLMSKGSKENDLNMLHISLKLSKILEAKQDFVKCEIGYTHCLKHLEELIKLDPDNEDILGLLSLTLDSYARYLLNRGDTKKAYAHFKKSYKTCVKLNGEIYEMNVILLNDLGTLCYVQGNVDKAFKYLNKAAKIGQHLPDMESFSTVYINLGNIYLKQGMLIEAEKSCTEGIKNAKRHNFQEGTEEANICLREVKNLMK
ncbi:tetratricopeptide repeat protein 19 homolog, mitochondrial [Adelges cooleyi]|uniref:tetratricopeptide repeat protein 19 homolog, mitochondrial n=1 Tax=Adelges cooleyi TaxID=133065 RepID=UPI00217FAF3D|nr:tetratricopeptide repeat protein 19 homolog, mitochondrial [Adelges cooleyi]XP_050426163.1 tetratricopeptide repeat protein 19 homolog, mitochondrial [Adelges cooleyi]